MKAKKFLFLTLLTTLSLTSCGKEGEQTPPEIEDNTITGGTCCLAARYKFKNAYEEDNVVFTKEGTFSYDFESLVTGDNKVYNKDLAKLSLLLSADAYPWGTVQTYNVFHNAFEDSVLMESIGLERVETITLDPEEYAKDKDDLAVAMVGKQSFYIDNVPQNVVVVSFRGTFDDWEWASNIDIGSDSDGYKYVAGTHFEWTNHEHHKGFDVTTNRMIDKIENYVSTYVPREGDITYLLTGHSRGGALANLYSVYLNSKNIKNYTYTFASPNTTSHVGDLVTGYENIFNIVNGDDLIVNIPPSEVGFQRYGIDRIVKVSEKQEAYKEITEERTYSSMDISTFTNLMKDIFISRDKIYEINSEPLNKEIKDNYSTLEAAQNVAEQVKNAAKNVGVSRFVQIGEPHLVEGTDKYGFKWKVSPYILLKALNDVLVTDRELLSITTALGKYSDVIPTYISQVFSSLAPLMFTGVGAVSEPHMPESYLTLANVIE